MTEHLTWCKSLQGGTAVDCNCEQARKWIVGEIATIAADNARLESEITRLRNDIEVMRNALKYYSDECDAGCFADWGERAKIALDTIESAMKEKP